MLRPLLAVVGLVQLVAPEKVIAVYTRLAYEGPEAFRVRRWVVHAMRLEGLTMLWLAVNGFGEDADEEALAEELESSSAPLQFRG